MINRREVSERYQEAVPGPEMTTPRAADLAIPGTLPVSEGDSNQFPIYRHPDRNARRSLCGRQVACRCAVGDSPLPRVVLQLGRLTSRP
jgi:hypothetical protein